MSVLWGPGGWLIGFGLGLIGAWYYRRKTRALENTLLRKRIELNKLKAEHKFWRGLSPTIAGTEGEQAEHGTAEPDDRDA